MLGLTGAHSEEEDYSRNRKDSGENNSGKINHWKRFA